MSQPARRRLPLRMATAIAWLLISIVLIVVHSIWLQWLGNALILRRPPEPADAVVVLAGGAPTRLPKGVELVRAGYAPTLYVLEDQVCPPLSTSRHCAHLSEARRKGLTAPLDDLLSRNAVVLLLPELPDGAAGTVEEAELAWARLREREVRRILLVTDEFHSHRATLAWQHVVAGEAVVIPVPSVTEHAPMAGWWRNRRSRKNVATEYAKFLVYVITGRI